MQVRLNIYDNLIVFEKEMIMRVLSFVVILLLSVNTAYSEEMRLCPTEYEAVELSRAIEISQELHSSIDKAMNKIVSMYGQDALINLVDVPNPYKGKSRIADIFYLMLEEAGLPSFQERNICTTVLKPFDFDDQAMTSLVMIRPNVDHLEHVQASLLEIVSRK